MKVHEIHSEIVENCKSIDPKKVKYLFHSSFIIGNPDLMIVCKIIHCYVDKNECDWSSRRVTFT